MDRFKACETSEFLPGTDHYSSPSDEDDIFGGRFEKDISMGRKIPAVVGASENGGSSLGSSQPGHLATPNISRPKGTKCDVWKLYGRPSRFPSRRIAWTTKIPPDVADVVENGDSKEYAIIVRRTKENDGQGRSILHSIVIQSSLLQQALSVVFKDYPGVATNLERLEFKQPFEPFVHRWSSLVHRYETETDGDTKKHLNLLVDVLTEDLEDIIARKRDLIANGLITHDLLWTIFEPGSLVFSPVDGQDRAFKYSHASGFYDERNGAYSFVAEFLDYNGSKCVRRTHKMAIPNFDSSVPIATLPAFPLRYHQYEYAVREQLINRGTFWSRFKDHHFYYYDGIAFDTTNSSRQRLSVDGRVVIDTVAFNKFNPSGAVSGTMLRSDTVDEEDQYLIATHFLYGYSIRDRKWLEFDISLIREIVWKTQAIESLVLPRGQEELKDLFLSLVKSQTQSQNSFDDVIPGKGRGLITLLAGPPGVGKTLTAECVAEALKVPLQIKNAVQLARLLAASNETKFQLSHIIRVLKLSIRNPISKKDSEEKATNKCQQIDCFNEAELSETFSHPSERKGRERLIASQAPLQFQRLTSKKFLDQAVDAANAALAAAAPTHSYRNLLVDNLVTCLLKRSERTESLEDLYDALRVASTASPGTREERAVLLGNTALVHGLIHVQTGSMDDLDKAIKDMLSEDASAADTDLEYRSGRLCNLGMLFSIRATRTGSTDEFNRAVECVELAINTTPLKEQNALMNLGAILSMRFQHTREPDDINRAGAILLSLFETLPAGHRHQMTVMRNLAMALSMRYQQNGLKDEIDAAIGGYRALAESESYYGALNAQTLYQLGLGLIARHGATNSEEDLNESIKVFESALDLTPNNHYEQASRLLSLGNALYKKSPSENFDQVLSLFTKGWECRNAQPSVRIELARSAALMLASRSEWPKSSALMKEAVFLLPSVSQRGLRQIDRETALSPFADLPSSAAALLLNAGEDAYTALEVLELGRGIITSVLLDTRSDITDLRQEHPILADKFESIRNQLDSMPDSASTMALGNRSITKSQELQNQLHKQFDDVVAEIRTTEGFGNFLRAPTTDQILSAASEGPLAYINTSSFRSDAILVSNGKIWHLPLPKLKERAIVEQVLRSSLKTNLREWILQGSHRVPGTPVPDSLEMRETASLTLELLGWLWDTVTGPVLNELHIPMTFQGSSDLDWPRMWWIPVGLMNRFPLHAAGRYNVEPSESVLDRVISSYSPSIKALIFSRSNVDRSHQIVSPYTFKALLASMRTTPSTSKLQFGDLHCAELELKAVEAFLPSSVKKHIIRQPMKKEIEEELKDCKFFHFIGHGYSDTVKPSRSSLLLQDFHEDPLTVTELARLKLYRGPCQLAYLSACSTGKSHLSGLKNEPIHIVGACQLAGFPQIIGSLWEIDDYWSIVVAQEVYKTLKASNWNFSSAALGVHRAARLLRDQTSGSSFGPGYAFRQEGIPLIWAAYVHIGA
ncbi:hypothetical protein BFJ71_g5730 [Fusarium oxysporum]|nr:hypothetical protein BFJ71_g5730 [Fusarium oxysporum]